MVRRLNAQGYAVETTADPATGADMALASPPAALIADLWMPTISGVQLCRLLRAEPATAEVPVVLRGHGDDGRSRFWAERAGATAYVVKGRMAELVRVLSEAVAQAKGVDDFFMQLSGGSVDIRDRIARHLDAALFESVIAAEVRALASCGSFERLFDLFSQFLSQVISYRWLSVCTTGAAQLALHQHPRSRVAEAEARTALGLPPNHSVLRIADEDARDELEGPAPIVCAIPFGKTLVGRLALAPTAAAEPDTATLVALVARELGGPLRIAELIDEAQRLATVDALTGLMNRRAFMTMMRVELARSGRYGMPLSLLLLDVDHFKTINDTHGHAAGDQVLASIGDQFKKALRLPDSPARWGGEEFVIALKNTDTPGAATVGERIRRSIQALSIQTGNASLSVTVSIGLSTFQEGDTIERLIDRSDRAMYLAKAGGRNRLVISSGESHPDANAPLVTTSIQPRTSATSRKTA